MEKVFVADDKFVDVIAALEKRGWIRSRHLDSPNFQLKWRNLSNINFRLLRTDQFVNHAFNSQQLSNKALLAGHLAFQHHYHHHHHKPAFFPEGSDKNVHGDIVAVATPDAAFRRDSSSGTTSCQHLEDNNGVRSSSSSQQGRNPPAEANYSAFFAVDPDVFFPRCCDVSEGGGGGGGGRGISLMLRAFTVSAAVALLRRAAANCEDCLSYSGQSYQRKDGGSDHSPSILTAAFSVVSRYVASLHHPTRPRPPPSPPPPPPPPPPPHRAEKFALPSPLSPPVATREEDTDGLVATTAGAVGQGAMEAAIDDFGDPEVTSVLKAWEAITAREEEGEDDWSAEEVDGRRAADSVQWAECNSVAEKQDRVCGEEAAAVENCVYCRVEHPEIVDRASSARGDGLVCGCVARRRRARELLQVLHAADPQAALLGPANAWVVKPAGLSCGRGVTAASSLRGVISACRKLGWKAVVQKYVERPLLVQGFKFDIRQWVLVTSCNPLVLWGFDESYARFSSRRFTMHASSLSDRFIHLCNHSVQKEQEGGFAMSEIDSNNPPPAASNSGYAPWAGFGPHQREHGEGGGAGGGEGGDACAGKAGGGGGEGETLPSGSQGNMWSAGQLRTYLRDQFQGRDVFRDVVMPRIRSVVVQTLLSVGDDLEMRGKAAVEWLGFDLMLTDDLRVMLIEVNVSPDVSHSTPVTARLVPPATEDALRLLLRNTDGKTDGEATDDVPDKISRSLASLHVENPPSEVPSSLPTTTTTTLTTTGTLERQEAVDEPDRPRPETVVSVAGSVVDSLRKPRQSSRGCCGGGGPREGESEEKDGRLRWRIWHSGEKKSQTTLRSAREEKKRWFRARRLGRQGRQRRRQTGDDDGRDRPRDDNDTKALAVIDGIVKSARGRESECRCC